MSFFSDYFTTQFMIYLFRWIISGVVMFLPLWVLVHYRCCQGKYQEYIHLLLVQIVGAFIFYQIDKYIFS